MNIRNEDLHFDPEDDGNVFEWILAAAMVSLLIFVGAIFLSCSPVKRMGAMAAKHPDAALQMCAQMFPGKTETVTKTEFVPGETVQHWDTVTVDCDSFIRSQHNSKVLTKLVRVPCPPSTHTVDTVIKTVTVTKTDVAGVLLLQNELAASKSDVAKFKARSKKQWWAIGIMGGLIAGTVVLRKFKVI